MALSSLHLFISATFGVQSFNCFEMLMVFFFQIVNNQFNSAVSVSNACTVNICTCKYRVGMNVWGFGTVDMWNHRNFSASFGRIKIEDLKSEPVLQPVFTHCVTVACEFWLAQQNVKRIS